MIAKNKTFNLFVSIAPSHNKNFEEMINAGLVEGTNVLINAGKYTYQNTNWDKVINGDRHMGNASGSIFRKLKFQIAKINGYKKIISEVNKVVPEIEFNLYYCNLEDVLNNYFFFKYRKNRIQERILVEDGILNYYDYKISKETKNTFLIKRMISRFLGVPYKIVKGQLSGIDLEIVKKQYVKSPCKAIYSEKAVELPQQNITYNPDSNILLFIGQDILENIMGKQDYLFQIEEIFTNIKEMIVGAPLVVYKPHRNGDYSSVVPLLETYFGDNYKLMLDNTPVEKLIAEIKPFYIFSFYSTALLNIQMSLPKNSAVQIFSKPLESVNPKVLNIFREVGIKLLK